ncbi:hypothetical protein H310_01697 [Aphanomyces invadans]|uniref:Uncharacterized protein n=1 Tax=Aphanomyces invadans TaxID=157072 RepID=A0A024UTQ9_9STRA|nr:hypothetical protein H310_01697 [Aphanomyces invadans]ETW09312.1 hypothetical protein H310_01697 [Aphanomyces invadans]|eukprot:XP_008863117.1 hypothetical protein H310_01697 [Aphanomyces invadans]
MTTTSLASTSATPANIRSGMSVQDLKMLTAQREYRIMMEQYTSTVGDASQLASSPRSNRSLSLSLSDTSSTGSANSPISSPVMSPQRHQAPFHPPPPPPMHLASSHKFNQHSHHHYHHQGSAYSRHGSPVEKRVLVTCGGQMVSVMEGVRNVPDDMCFVGGSPTI